MDSGMNGRVTYIILLFGSGVAICAVMAALLVLSWTGASAIGLI